jgi:hypothetical protein
MGRIVNNNTRSDTYVDRNGVERPKAKYYLNVGYPFIDPDTGEETFVSLGFGLDTLPKISGSAAIMQRKRNLLSQLLDMAEGIEPGQDDTVEGLEIRIRHVGEAENEQQSFLDEPKIRLVSKKMAAE